MNFNDIVDSIKEKPYYLDRDYGQVIYCSDNRLILPQIPDKSIDLVLTDPPYNVGIDYGDSSNDKLPAVAYQKLIKELIERFLVMTDGKVALVLGSKPLLDWWMSIPKAKLIIVKMGAISNNKIKGLHLQYHPVLTTVQSNTYMSDLWEDIRWPGEGYFFNEERYGHPAMTPEKLARRLVSIFTDGPEKIVLDAYCGSGTMAVASKCLNRFFIGIEIEEKYCEIAKNRLAQSVMRLETE